MIRAAIAAGLALALAGCATTAAAPAHPEARAYAPRPDAMADVDAALARAAASGKRVALVLGANWCHDSRALAGWLETSRFAALVAEHYELVFVNVGMPQTGEGRNLEIARRFGLDELKGTPALLVLTADGRAVNLESAAKWRDAASRSEDAIYAELVELAGTTETPAPARQMGKDEADAAPLSVWVAGDAAGCRVALSPEGPWQSTVSELAEVKGAPLIYVRKTAATPWRCVAGSIFKLQKLGVKVEFASEPAPPPGA